jgi:hypothetical protein
VGAVPVVPADLGIHETADRALKTARATCRPTWSGVQRSGEFQRASRPLPTTRPVRWRPPVPADVDPQRSRPAIPQFRGGHSADLTAEYRAGSHGRPLHRAVGPVPRGIPRYR